MSLLKILNQRLREEQEEARKEEEKNLVNALVEAVRNSPFGTAGSGSNKKEGGSPFTTKRIRYEDREGSGSP